MLRQTLALSALLSLVLVCVGPLGLKVIFGPQFEGATAALLVLSISSMVANVGFVATACLNATGKGMQTTAIQAISLITSVGSLALLGPLYGSVGAACASGIGSVLLVTFATSRLRVSARAMAPSLGDIRAGLARLVSH
ncbi:O-antigen/teichoic acid export membrane protein [Sinomonas atrocyanea]|nr:O-antigen/teichoic acid export membrane protein [Sinomonas atrocyanea]